jgi:diguanylate cyclase (GGDEF)-like protein
MNRPAAIWNRDSILELLNRERLRSAREGGPMGVMLAGVDQSRTIFSEQGQARGEAVLGEVAKRMSSLLRPYDHVGRYSTEQLLVVAPGCKPENLLPLAEKIREGVADFPIDASGTRVPVTVSLAVATAADGPLHQDQDEEALLRELDKVLYRAQINGGNRVESLGKTKPEKPSVPSERISIPLLLAGLILLGILAVFVLAPAWACAPFRIGDIMDSSELPAPLPLNCLPTSDTPSDATIESLENQRQARGLILQSTVTCKILLPTGARASRMRDPHPLENLYPGGTIEYKRHILIAASQDVPGGTLCTVELCLVPWWKYIDQAGDRCWAQLEFWK